MTSTNIQQWIDHPEALDRDTLYELRTLLARYPYFQSARLLYLKNLYLLHDAGFGAELRKAVLYIADGSLLFYMIEGARAALRPEAVKPSAAVPQEEAGGDRTLMLINAFLATVPEEYTRPVGLDYSMDYMAALMQEDAEQSTLQPLSQAPAKPLRGQALIDSFIKEEQAGTTAKPASAAAAPSVEASTAPVLGEPTAPGTASASAPATAATAAPKAVETAGDDGIDESCFTETLAKIYIKQHRYEKALEIIKRLSLNYPNKNAYFADQIRFLEKVIINTKLK